ncbi:MAG: hypothetical protein Tsb0013_18810 [Phycisphaerales bacterium]
MLSPLIGLPIAFATLILLAGHVMALADADQPALTRRIRIANGVLMMITCCAIYAGMCVFVPERSPREWALSWMLVMLLITLHVLLAMADTINTAVIRRRSLRQITSASQRLREELASLGVHLERDHASARSE